MLSTPVYVSDYGEFRVADVVLGLYPKEKLDGRTREAKRIQTSRREYEAAMNWIAKVAWDLGLDSPKELFPE